MNQNRYKASFPSQDSNSEFFDSSTWVMYGFFAMIIFSFFAHGIMYFHPDTGFAHYSDLKIIGINAVGFAVLFILKLFAQNIYVIGKYMSFLSVFASLSILILMFYITFIDHFPIAYISGVLYFGVAGYLLNKDYKELITAI